MSNINKRRLKANFFKVVAKASEWHPNDYTFGDFVRRLTLKLK